MITTKEGDEIRAAMAELRELAAKALVNGNDKEARRLRSEIVALEIIVAAII